jgi:hypothetical protein
MSRVLAVNDPDAGVLAILLRPTARRATTVVHDALHALGKDRDTRDRPSRATDDVRNAVAYGRAHGITHLVVGHSQWATDAAQQLSTAFELATKIGSSLTLVTDAGDFGGVRDFVEGLDGRHTTWRAVERMLPDRLRPAAPVDVAVDTSPREVPHTDFPLFRATCRDTLEPKTFKVVDDLYRATFHQACQRLTSDMNKEDVATELQNLLSTVSFPAGAIVIVRAVQAAALTRGLLVKLSLPRLTEAVSDGSHRRLTRQEMRVLRRVPDPWLACTAVLVDGGCSVDAALDLRPADFDTTGQSRTAAVAALCDEARLHVRAQLFHREELEGTDDGPLLGQRTPRQVRDGVHRLRRHLELPLSLSRFRDVDRSETTARQLHLTVTRVPA